MRNAISRLFLRYPWIWWRGIFRCIRRGHHLWVFGHGVPTRWWYCWDCFYGFPWEGKGLTLGKRIRSFIGRFIPIEAPRKRENAAH